MSDGIALTADAEGRAVDTVCFRLLECVVRKCVRMFIYVFACACKHVCVCVYFIEELRKGYSSINSKPV